MSSSNSSAGKRIEALLDEKSFVEIGSAVTARATDFNLKPAETPSDGVVTGYGTIGGKPVYVYSQDASVLGGSISAVFISRQRWRRASYRRSPQFSVIAAAV